MQSTRGTGSPKYLVVQAQRIPWLIERHPTMVLGIVLLVIMAGLALGAPLWTRTDPLEINPIDRLQGPSAEHWFGTDHLGRDIYTRTIYGSRISLTVGVCVAVISIVAGLSIGLFSGYNRRADAVVMRVMDGLMAILGILLATALIALVSASVQNVIIALSIPEIPRVVRLARVLVLTLREQLFVEAIRAAGAGAPRI